MFAIDIISRPLGYIIKIIYDITQNYGVSLIIFTVLVKLLLLPLGIKSQKSMMQTQKLQPLLQKINQKYKNDKELLQRETMKLYQEYKINPLGGCLPLLVQLPILFALVGIVYSPCRNILMMSQDTITALCEEFGIVIGRMHEIELANALYLAGEGGINFRFMTLDLADTPSLSHFSTLWIIPILASAMTYLSSKLNTLLTPQNASSAQGNQMSETMMTVMPLMTLWITFTMPVSAGLYWLISTVTQIIQQWGLSVYFKKNLPDLPEPEVTTVSNRRKTK